MIEYVPRVTCTHHGQRELEARSNRANAIFALGFAVACCPDFDEADVISRNTRTGHTTIVYTFEDKLDV